MSVRIISTGGTIASTDTTGGDAAPELSAERLVAAIPELGEIADITTDDFSNVPSPHLTIDDFYELTQTIQTFEADSESDGVVVTIGTDILEEAAYFVDLCYDGSMPVVFTGAMRNPSLPSPDGPANLLASARTAMSDPAAEAGVLVTFNDRVYAAREVTKMHSMNVDTFQAPEFGPLAVIDETQVRWRHRHIVTEPTLTPKEDALTNDIHAVTVTADMPSAQIRGATDSNGLCLAATGAGHIPPTIIPVLESLRDDGIPLIATTRCPEGRLARETYGFKGSEATLQELGFYYSDLNLQKTRIKTIVALAADELDVAFDRPTK
ncbi:asparaginase [Haladaptatus halobius]|uniref:asparaginase n=1 Tax=Haladaptatus halobius TaxID=2884875 RepID=UPI001D0B1943|nr:asparaginase [Haladaptatus halobius]